MQTTADFALDLALLTGAGRLAAPTKVAVVGAGRWAKVICKVLAEFSPPLAEIVVVAERNFPSMERWAAEQRASAAAGKPDVVVRPSLDDVLACDGLGAAFVTKMASEHYLATRQLLLAGKHVLVEKPFVLSAAEADELVELARAGRRVLAVGYEFMFARPLHHFRTILEATLPDVQAASFVWDDVQGIEKWGVRKQPDLSANVVTDLYPHILSQLLLLFGRQPIELRRLVSRECSAAQIELTYGPVLVTVSLNKNADRGQRRIAVESSGGHRLSFDYSQEPGAVELDGRPVDADPLATEFPPSLTAEVAYFFARIAGATERMPNSADDTMQVVEATEQANAALVARQTEEVRDWLWRDLASTVPEAVLRILRHQTLGGLLRHGLVQSPKDTEALDRWAALISRIIYRFSREPWTEQSAVQREEALETDALVRVNAAMRDSAFVQDLIVRQGVARQVLEHDPAPDRNRVDPGRPLERVPVSAAAGHLRGGLVHVLVLVLRADGKSVRALRGRRCRAGQRAVRGDLRCDAARRVDAFIGRWPGAPHESESRRRDLECQAARPQGAAGDQRLHADAALCEAP